MRVERPAAGDFVAGLSVACVLVPQSLAYAQLAGMPPERGLLAAALPPIAAALVASSPYLQTGPVALTSLLTFGALSALAEPGSQTYVELGILLALVIGLVRLAIGVCGLGRIAYAMSPPVVTGFVCAAAVLIVGSQLPTALGTATDGGIVPAAARAAADPSGWNTGAALLAFATIGVVIGGARLSRRLPAVVVATALGVAVGTATSYGGATVGAFSTAFPDPRLDLPWLQLPALLLAGTVIAIVGFAETAAVARSLAASDRRPWHPSREFAGQGLANLAAASAGAFPVGGSFSRTALNKLAGARTRWSGAVTGIAVLAALPAAPAALANLPRAVLAGIVIASVLSFARPREILRLCRLSPPQGAIALATFAATIALAPHVQYAVLVGIGLSIANHLVRELPVDIQSTVAGTTLHVRPRGVLWFGSARTLEERLTELLAQHPEVRSVDVDLGGLGRIDYSGALVLRSVADDLAAAGVRFRVSDPSPRAQRIVAVVMGESLAPPLPPTPASTPA